MNPRQNVDIVDLPWATTEDFRMKFFKFLGALALVSLALLTTAVALSPYDPAGRAPVVVFDAVTANTTSNPFAVAQTTTGQVLQVHIFSGGGAGTLVVEGALDTEADVQADTANWVTIFSGTNMDAIVYVEDPPAYVRFDLTHSSGTISTQVRGASLREIVITP